MQFVQAVTTYSREHRRASTAIIDCNDTMPLAYAVEGTSLYQPLQPISALFRHIRTHASTHVHTTLGDDVSQHWRLRNKLIWQPELRAYRSVLVTYQDFPSLPL